MHMIFSNLFCFLILALYVEKSTISPVSNKTETQKSYKMRILTIQSCGSVGYMAARIVASLCLSVSCKGIWHKCNIVVISEDDGTICIVFFLGSANFNRGVATALNNIILFEIRRLGFSRIQPWKHCLNAIYVYRICYNILSIRDKTTEKVIV